MSDPFEGAPIVADVLYVDVTLDESYIVPMVRLTDGTSSPLPMTKAAAIRLLFFLDKVRQKRGWQLPDDPGTVDRIQ